MVCFTFTWTLSFWNENAVKASTDRKHESAGQPSQSTFRTGMNPYLLYMTLMERADRFRSGTKIWIRCDYRDEVVLERLVLEYNFG